MKKKPEKPIKVERSLFISLIMGIGIAYALTCIIFIGYALLLTYTSVTEKYIPLVVILTSIASVILAGYDASKGAKEKGWLWGIIAGVIYIVILFLVGAFVTKDFSIGTNMITLILISIAGGGFGGILGINFRK